MMPTRAEIAGIMSVMQSAFDPAYGEAWNEAQVTSALLVPGTRFALADAAGIIGPPSPSVPSAGFYLSRQTLDEEELLLLAVLPEYRRSGCATRLFEHLTCACRDRGVARLFLEMRADNTAAHFYQKMGFQPVGLRKAYYRGADGQYRDARTLALDLA
ncbi:GNAT family N-acetyltransferase [Croceicoccus naphthovorans]|uniref:Uncharacterized protein n=1 Tax=Croceicoccus naphthovorans TaxID=1348774 RepID=A0A0G3XJF2_9SPHN|nr:GNAT family N-acetyltransferase [Croceicoccus naphthovorans]AKM10513.1 hypothetical protein AB433_11955 [Croceicoccus naphthovorans]MBB3988704.1 ribosomal-protein-alanine N-acetyltransferase [Croceicoccus naphthovorans]